MFIAKASSSSFSLHLKLVIFYPKPSLRSEPFQIWNRPKPSKNFIVTCKFLNITTYISRNIEKCVIVFF